MPIQSVQRALNILSFFSASRPQLGITEISKLMNLPKTTVHGLVQTLTQEGFLNQDIENKKYTLGLKIYELSTYLLSTLKINQVGMDSVQKLAQKTSLMARIGIWDKDSILVTANSFPDAENHQFNIIGPRVPGYCSALGKIFLATYNDSDIEEYLSKTPLTAYTEKTITDKSVLLEHIKEIRKTGYAREDEEYINNMSCISAPVYDNTGSTVASVSVSGLLGFLENDKIKELIIEVKKTGMDISQKMGYFPDPLKINPMQ
ncbi:MAG: IclR family transcriptional regulator [Desulfobacterales bacterium]|nr:IclR family transcriptional regulator [Desulfobacterales bacterium]MCP4158494.1 IclR family transcriptional regulator [Deltaproteobacteria bacterium]